MAGAETYDFGECTWYVAETLAWIPGGLGNATDWAAGAAARGLSLADRPQVGAVVVYAAGGGYSEFGHVGIVREVYSPESFLVSEMNFSAWDTVDYRVSTRYDVEAFILPPTGAPSLGGGLFLGDGGTDALAETEAAWEGLRSLLNGDLPGAANALSDLGAAIAAVA